MDAELVVIK